jgi:hypothetical protein
MSLLRDEQGNWSSARCAFWVTLVVTLALIVFDSCGVVAMAGAAYTLLGSLVIALASWAAGPRIASYLAPQIGKVGAAIASASAKVVERRKQGTDDGTEPT